MKWKTYLAGSACVLALSATSASAQSMAGSQTPAGTSITNSVDLVYNSGGKSIEMLDAASTTFVVDRKVDAVLDGLNSGGVVVSIPGEDGAVLSFSLQNTSNDASGYDFDIAPSGSDGAMTLSKTVSATPGEFWVMISDNPNPGEGVETIYDPEGVINARDLPADGTIHVHVYANVPLAAKSRQQYAFALTATALKPGTTEAWQAEGDGDLATVDTVIVGDTPTLVRGDSQMIDVYAPVVSAVKTVKVLNNGLTPFDCENGAVPVANDIEALPGACVEYTVTVINAPTGSAPATGIVMTDELPEDLDFVAVKNGDFLSVTTPGSDRVVTANLPILDVGTSAAFAIRARIKD